MAIKCGFCSQSSIGKSSNSFWFIEFRWWFCFSPCSSHSTEDAKYTFSYLRCFFPTSSRELYENGHTANYVQCIISYNLFKCFGAKDQIANGKTISKRVKKRSQLACEANFTRRYFFLLTHHKCKKMYIQTVHCINTYYIHTCWFWQSWNGFKGICNREWTVKKHTGNKNEYSSFLPEYRTGRN